jgi:hypothetical protein
MPRDVATRWNSTYNMLEFALEYRSAIDELSGDRDMRKYELDDEEWNIVQQLCNLLEVRSATCIFIHATDHGATGIHVLSDFQGRDPIFFTFYPQPCHRNTCDGSYRRPPRHCKPRLGLLSSDSCFSGTRKNPSKQILRYDRLFRSLPNSNE